MVEEKKKKPVNWNFFRKRCPECKSIEIIHKGIFRRKWMHLKSGRWELREQQKYKCVPCKNVWWE